MDAYSKKAENPDPCFDFCIVEVKDIHVVEQLYLNCWKQRPSGHYHLFDIITMGEAHCDSPQY